MAVHDEVRAGVPEGFVDETQKDHATAETTAHPDHESESSGEEVLQDGVKNMEAITAVLSVKQLVVTYALIYLVSFTDSLQQQITGNLTAYVTSAFSQHSLTATTRVLSGIIGGVSKLPIAKIINIWGRVEGFSTMVVLCTLGLIMMAACQNVETYAAAQVFYWVGYNGMGYILSIFIADTTTLLNRTLINGINSTPFIATTFAGPEVAQLFYTKSSFRWAFGSFAIITPVISIPVTAMLVINHKKAKKQGLIEKRQSGRTWKQSLLHYAIEFDAVGMFLVVAGWALILLPLQLAASAPHRWDTPYIIAMLVLGVVLVAAFFVWEKFFAKVSFIPYKYLTDRTILGSCILAPTLGCSFYCWDLYFSSYLQVVHNLSIRDAGYVVNIYNIGSCFWAPIVGLLIRWTGKFKWLGICAVPVYALGTGLLVYFRQPDSYIGYVCMCQIFLAFAGGTLVMCEGIAVMAAVPHNEVAVANAVFAMFGAIGGSIGSSISGTIWTQEFPKALLKHLPEDQTDLVKSIVGSLAVQLSYPTGSPVRNGIIAAYGDVQHKLLIAGAAFMPVALIAVLLWKNYNLKQMDQVKAKF